VKRCIAGAGAQGRVVLETWRAQHPHDEFFFLDDASGKIGTDILGAKVLGGFSLLAGLNGEVIFAVGINPLRLRLASEWGSKGVRFGRAVHPSAVISPTARIGDGSVVFAMAVVNTEAVVGNHVIVNTAVVVEHDAVIEDGVALCPGVRTGGGVFVGRGAFVATGVTLGVKARVGAGAIVGAGAVVTREVPARTLAYGVPARVVGQVDEAFDWKRVL
jgi:sugar O-acyltransferase (sialic acid O-acetyltransferase NeuD family)